MSATVRARPARAAFSRAALRGSSNSCTPSPRRRTARRAITTARRSSCEARTAQASRSSSWTACRATRNASRSSSERRRRACVVAAREGRQAFTTSRAASARAATRARWASVSGRCSTRTSHERPDLRADRRPLAIHWRMARGLRPTSAAASRMLRSMQPCDEGCGEFWQGSWISSRGGAWAGLDRAEETPGRCEANRDGCGQPRQVWRPRGRCWPHVAEELGRCVRQNMAASAGGYAEQRRSGGASASAMRPMQAAACCSSRQTPTPPKIDHR